MHAFDGSLRGVAGRPVSIATWNCRALFMGLTSKRRIEAFKHSLLSRLVNCHDVVCLQEAHGVPGDEVELEKFPHMKAFASFGHSTACGGVVVLAAHVFCASFAEVVPRVLDPGRILEVCFIDAHAPVQVINVHINPNYPDVEKNGAVDVIHGAIQLGMHCITIGDFNFVPGDECRYNVQNKDELPNNDPLSAYWEDRMDVLTVLPARVHSQACGRWHACLPCPSRPRLLQPRGCRPCRLQRAVLNIHERGGPEAAE